MRRRRRVALVLAAATAIGPLHAHAGDAVAGKAIFDKICHACHAAKPYVGRIGVDNLPKFLANPKGYKPDTAMGFPGLRDRKDIDDVIAFLTGER